MSNPVCMCNLSPPVIFLRRNKAWVGSDSFFTSTHTVIDIVSDMHDGSHLLVHSQSNSQSDTAVVTVTLGHSYGQLQLRGSQSQLQPQSQLVTVTVSHYPRRAEVMFVGVLPLGVQWICLTIQLSPSH